MQGPSQSTQNFRPKVKMNPQCQAHFWINLQWQGQVVLNPLCQAHVVINTQCQAHILINPQCQTQVWINPQLQALFGINPQCKAQVGINPQCKAQVGKPTIPAPCWKQPLRILGLLLMTLEALSDSWWSRSKSISPSTPKNIVKIHFPFNNEKHCQNPFPLQHRKTLSKSFSSSNTGKKLP